MANVMTLQEREERDEQFVREFVNNGGNATKAAKSCGVSGASASNTGYRMKERLWEEIEYEIASALKGFVPKGVHQLMKLAESAESENVRLNANRDLLDRVGLTSPTKQEITQVNKIENMTKEELEGELSQIRDEWLAEYLEENNLVLANTQ